MAKLNAKKVGELIDLGVKLPPTIKRRLDRLAKLGEFQHQAFAYREMLDRIAGRIERDLLEATAVQLDQLAGQKDSTLADFRPVEDKRPELDSARDEVARILRAIEAVRMATLEDLRAELRDERASAILDAAWTEALQPVPDDIPLGEALTLGAHREAVLRTIAEVTLDLERNDATKAELRRLREALDVGGEAISPVRPTLERVRRWLIEEAENSPEARARREAEEAAAARLERARQEAAEAARWRHGAAYVEATSAASNEDQ